MHLWTYSENKTTLSFISYSKAVTGSGQAPVNGKGQEEKQQQTLHMFMFL